MAKKKITEKRQSIEPYKLHTCGDCGWGKFTYEIGNLDLAGRPICLKCTFVENRRKIRSEKACDKWKAKSPKDGRSAK